MLDYLYVFIKKVLYITGFLDCVKARSFASSQFIFFVIPTEVERISLFVVPYFILRDFSTALEMTNYKPIKSTRFNGLKIGVSRKDFAQQKIFGKKEQSHLCFTVYNRKRLTFMRIATLSRRRNAEINLFGYYTPLFN